MYSSTISVRASATLFRNKTAKSINLGILCHSLSLLPLFLLGLGALSFGHRQSRAGRKIRSKSCSAWTRFYDCPRDLSSFHRGQFFLKAECTRSGSLICFEFCICLMHDMCDNAFNARSFAAENCWTKRTSNIVIHTHM